MKIENSDLFGEDTNKVSVKELFQKYFSYWPLFLISLLVFTSAGIFYLRYKEPKYISSTLILVKEDQEKKVTDDLLENALSGNTRHSTDLDNQIVTITTTPVLERVVAKNNFNISYYNIGKLRKNDIYLDAPFRLIPENVNDSSTVFAGTIKMLTDEGGILEYGNEKKPKEFNFKWNNAFKITKNIFTLARKAGYKYEGFEKYRFIWRPTKQVATDIASNLTVSILDKKTSIIKLTFVSTNIRYSEDILNAVFKEFNQRDIEDRNIITQNSIRFIDDRLSLMSKELSGVEGNLQNYQGRNALVNVETQSSQSFENSNDISKNISNLGMQQGVVNMIRSYFNSPTTQDKLVPSTLGLEDPTLSSLIARYNELQLRKQREAPLVAAGSTVMKDLNDQLTDIRGSILESLQNLNKNLSFQEKNLEQQNSQYRQFLSSLPQKERAMQEIKRKQGVTESLYLYLLQKREEAAISSTSSSISNYRQIEPAKGFGPIEPIETNVWGYTILLGLFIPIVIVYFKDKMNDTVTTRRDILKKIQVPILGDINHLTSKQAKGIAVAGRDIVSEQFRIIRTNLSILLKKKEKAVILISSAGAGEGKSTVSTNLAAVMSLAGKKVALLEFDLRKPVISALLEVENENGLTAYLNRSIDNIEEIKLTIAGFPNLDFFPAGNISANPADVLLNSTIETLFIELKTKYDYIIIDSAPAALVTDGFILAQFSDIVLFVIRQRKTLKKQLAFIEDVNTSKRMKNINLIFNDIKTGGKFGYYGYGNTNGKGYDSDVTNFKTKQKTEKLLLNNS